jgi:hypothetical protein
MTDDNASKKTSDTAAGSVAYSCWASLVQLAIGHTPGLTRPVGCNIGKTA